MKSKLLLIVSLFAASSALAGKYGTAGCGLGSLVFGDQPGMIQLAAATTNNILVPQTSAITTGTSNCTEDGVALQDKEQDYYAEANFESLRQEMAQGSGENLNAFASLFGCSGNGTAHFGQMMQSNYSSIFAQPTPQAMLENVRSVYSNQMGNTCNEG